MKPILQERTRKFNFKDEKGRRFYLESVATEVNNRLVDPELKPMDRSRYFNIQIQIVKLIHDMQTDASIEELESRITEIEEHYHEVSKKFSKQS